MKVNLRDSVNMVAKSSFSRALNAARIYTSFHTSTFTGKPSIQGLPISLSFEPTTSCNLRCPECPSGLRSFTRPTGMLQEELFRNVIDQLASPKTSARASWFLRKVIGAGSRSYLKTAAKRHPSPTVRRRAAAVLKRR